MIRRYFTMADEAKAVGDPEPEPVKEEKKSEDSGDGKKEKKKKEKKPKAEPQAGGDSKAKVLSELKVYLKSGYSKILKGSELSLVVFTKKDGNTVVEFRKNNKNKIAIGIEKNLEAAFGEALVLLSKADGEAYRLVVKKVLEKGAEKKFSSAYKSAGKNREADLKSKAKQEGKSGGGGLGRKLGVLKGDIDEGAKKVKEAPGKAFQGIKNQVARGEEKKAAKLLKKAKQAADQAEKLRGGGKAKEAASLLIKKFDRQLDLEDRIAIAKVMDFNVEISKRTLPDKIKNNQRSQMLSALMKGFGGETWKQIKELIQSKDWGELEDLLTKKMRTAVKLKSPTLSTYQELSKRGLNDWGKFFSAITSALNPKGLSPEKSPVGLLIQHQGNAQELNDIIDDVVRDIVARLKKTQFSFSK